MTAEEEGQYEQYTNIASRAVVKLWPELQNAGKGEQRQGYGIILSTALGLLIFGITLIWLSLETQLDDLKSQWILVAILFTLRIIAGQLDLSSLLFNDRIFNKGAAARVITWSAVLIFGPIALWLDIGAIIANAIISYPRKGNVISPVESGSWRYLSAIPTISIRDTLPVLIVLAVMSPSFPIVSFEFDLFPGGAGLLETLLKTGVSVLLMLPLFIFEIAFISRPSGALTELLVGIRSARFILGSLLVLGLLDLLGLMTANLYYPENSLPYATGLIVSLLLALFLHYLNRRGLRSRYRVDQLEHLEHLNQKMLSVDPAERDYPIMLRKYIPKIFPSSLIEIRLVNDTVLFTTQVDQPLLDRRILDQLENSSRLYLEVRIGQEGDTNFTGTAVPVYGLENHQLLGAIAGVPSRYALSYEETLPALYSLSNLIASSLHQTELIEKALNAQAEAFHEEIFSQAYEAEMTIAYQRVSRELSLAGEIQNSFLPERVPDIPGWQITVTLEPARETSGDYYDFIELPNGMIGLLIADVTDKGIGASLYMALSRTLIRTYALEFHNEPAKVLEAANRRILQDSKSDLFVTVFYLVLNPEDGRITYCNAGHNPPFIWHGNEPDQAVSLTRTALPLGIFEGEEWTQNTIQILPEDTLALYTDGVTEAEDEDDGFFGEERLKSIISQNLDKSAQIIEDKILSDLAHFTGDAPQSDDITLIIVKRD